MSSRWKTKNRGNLNEDKPLLVDLHKLTPEERTLYDDLRDNRIRPGLRLEQEHIASTGWLIALNGSFTAPRTSKFRRLAIGP